MKTLLSSAALAGLFAAGTAVAGGFVAPVVDVEPVVVPPVVVGNWQGAYVGVTLGYAFDHEDRFGYHDVAAPNPYFGYSDTFKMDGALGGIRAGYRWQNGKWVFGPEISFEGGSVKDSFDAGTPPGVTSVGSVTGPTPYHFKDKLRSLVQLKVKGGYEVAPNTLITGTVGVASGRYRYEVSNATTSETWNYSKSGVVYGVGVEHKVNDNWSVSGEVERNQFKRKEVVLDGVHFTRASPSFTTVKLGVNFNF